MVLGKDMTESTLKYILNKFHIEPKPNSPVILPGTRLDLAKLFNDLGYKTGAEIGVESGKYSKIICDNNSLDKLYCIDSWTTAYGYSEPGKGENTMQRRYKAAQEILSGYPCEIIKKTSMDAVKDFSPNSLDFVYIDANHDFDYVLEDITEWAKIVRPGGIVSGHDYVAQNYSHTIKYGVIDATNNYIKAHHIHPLFVFGDERSASWFFVNE